MMEMVEAARNINIWVGGAYSLAGRVRPAGSAKRKFDTTLHSSPVSGRTEP